MSALSGWLSPDRPIPVSALLPGLQEVEENSVRRGQDNIRSKDGDMEFAIAINQLRSRDWIVVEALLHHRDSLRDLFVTRFSSVSSEACVAEITSHEPCHFSKAQGAPVSIFSSGLVTASVGNLSDWARDNPYDSEPTGAGIFDDVAHCPGRAFNRYVNEQSQKMGLRKALTEIITLPYSIYSCAFNRVGNRLSLHLYRSVEHSSQGDHSPYLSWVRDDNDAIFFASTPYMIPGSHIEDEIRHLEERSVASFKL